MNTPSYPEARALPHNPEAERAVIGAMFIDRAAVDSAAAALSFPGAFYTPAHGLVFDAIVNTTRDGSPADLVAVSDRLESTGKLEEAGGQTGLMALCGGSVTGATVHRHIEIVRRDAQRRRLIHACYDVVERAFTGDAPVAELLDAHGGTVSEIGAVAKADRTQSIAAVVPGVMDYLAALCSGDAHQLGLETGWADLDRLIRLRPGEMIVVAARPSIGKSALLANLATDLAVRRGVPVGLFSLEMAARSIGLRMVSGLAGISLRDLTEGAPSQATWDEITDASEAVGRAPIFIDDTSDLSARDIRARARAMVRDHGVRVLLLDYLQFVSPNRADRNATRENRVGEISRELKRIARELDVPVVVAAQLNRAAEDTQRPRLRHLRESGAIEQDSDIVILLHRERLELTEPNVRAIPAELVVAKHRNGPTGLVPMQFRPGCTRFETGAPSWDEV